MKAFIAMVLFVIIWSLLLPLKAEAMGKSELVDYISADSGLTKADAAKALNAYIKIVSSMLAKGNTVELIGFGTFSVETGSSGKTVHFKPGQDLQNRISMSSDLSVTKTAQCVYTLSKISQILAPAVGSGNFSVTFNGSCSLQASTNANWIAVTAVENGNGKGTVNFSVQSNTGSDQRMGYITVGDKIFTVKQYGRGGAKSSGKSKPQ